MPRATKKGLSYFPLEVDIWKDPRFRKLMTDDGADPVFVYIVILSLIYDAGYYLETDIETLAYDISFIVKFKEPEKDISYIEGIIGKLIKLRFFDGDLIEEGIFTSKGIQKQFLACTIRRKRNDYEYWLLTPEDESSAYKTVGNCQPNKKFKEQNATEMYLEGTNCGNNVPSGEINEAFCTKVKDKYKVKAKDKEKEKEDRSDKYDKGLYPGHLNYFTSCLIEDEIISIYHKDIERFNKLFKEAEIAYPDFGLRQRVFRYVRDYVQNRREPIDNVFDYFHAAFGVNLEKMEGYDERMREWREECQAVLGGVRR